MKSASALFNTQDRESVAAAIAEAERITTGEIVPVVATVSGRYDRAEDLFGLVFGVVALSIAWLLFQDTTQTAWSATPTPVLGLGVIVGILIVGFLAGAVLATYIPVLRLPFISRTEMLEEVERRALETFQRVRIRDTASGTGVLIYVSLYERVVKVIGDDAAAATLPMEALEEICALVVDGLKQGQPAVGLAQAVKKTGELLAPNLPPTLSDTNELANQLIIID
jgi:putative membrane protein